MTSTPHANPDLSLDAAFTALWQSVSAQERAEHTGLVAQPDTCLLWVKGQTSTAVRAVLQAQNAAQHVASHFDCGGQGLLCSAALAVAASSDAQLGLALGIDLLLLEGDGISDSRMDVGDSKNWAQQVGTRRHEQTLLALFEPHSGCVLQVPRSERGAVLAALRTQDWARHTFEIGKPRLAGDALEADKHELSVWRDAAKIFAVARSALNSAQATADRAAEAAR